MAARGEIFDVAVVAADQHLAVGRPALDHRAREGVEGAQRPLGRLEVLRVPGLVGEVVLEEREVGGHLPEDRRRLAGTALRDEHPPPGRGRSVDVVGQPLVVAGVVERPQLDPTGGHGQGAGGGLEAPQEARGNLDLHAVRGPAAQPEGVEVLRGVGVGEGRAVAGLRHLAHDGVGGEEAPQRLVGVAQHVPAQEAGRGLPGEDRRLVARRLGPPRHAEGGVDVVARASGGQGGARAIGELGEEVLRARERVGGRFVGAHPNAVREEDRHTHRPLL